MSQPYRDEPKNVPHNHEGKPFEGGPWIRLPGAVSDSFDGCWEEKNMPAGAGSFKNKIIILASKEEGLPEGEAAVFATVSSDLNKKILAGQRCQRHALDYDIQTITKQPDGQFTSQSDSLRPEYHGFAHDLSTPSFPKRLGAPCYKVENMPLYKVSGAHYAKYDDPRTLTIPEEIRDQKYLGTYNTSPTGILTVIDNEGQQFIGQRADRVPENNHTLEQFIAEDCGFHRRRDLEVPFSQKEIFLDHRRQDSPSLHSRDLDHFVSKAQSTLAYKRGLQKSASKEVVFNPS